MKCAVALLLLAAAPARAEPVKEPVKEPGALELTWLVYPDLPAKQDQLAATPVSLVATIGGVDRVIALAPQIGQLRPYYQPVCAGASALPSAETPLGRGEVARITFDEGGFGGFVVRRRGGHGLEVIAWSLEDGACDNHGKPVACPRRDKRVTELDVPAGVTVREHLVRVDARGMRRAFACR